MEYGINLKYNRSFGQIPPKMSWPSGTNEIAGNILTENSKILTENLNLKDT